MRVARAHGRIVGQLDDSLVIVRDLQLELRYQHPPAFDAADLADAERHVLAWNERARRHKNALHSRSRIRRAADDLHCIAGTRIHHADPQSIGVGVLLGGKDPCNGKRRKQIAAVDDPLHLEPDHGELVDDCR